MERFLHMPGIEIDNSWKKSREFLENIIKKPYAKTGKRNLSGLKSSICMFDAWKKNPKGWLKGELLLW